MPPLVTSLLFLDDAGMGEGFLVDIYRCISLLPRPLVRTRCSLAKSAHVRLVASNVSVINTYGYENFALSFVDIKFICNFFVADVKLLILDGDFLSNYQLVVNAAHQQLVNPKFHFSTPFQPAPSDLALPIIAPRDAYAHFLMSYPEVFCQEIHQTAVVHTKHGVYLYIQTTRPPLSARFRCLAPDHLEAAKQTFAEMDVMGLCQKASSSCLSPLHIILKKDGSLILWRDYRRLYMQTGPDHYSLPNIADMTSYLHKAMVFSTVYLLKDYYQVPGIQ
ncbi:uncharacterized protein [Palaemon carinicauda]|uniref:uncharacterized protein n=1 Tax=Palaemon carinicauda TaxID=392227 RepID=UPI0035B57EB8